MPGWLGWALTLGFVVAAWVLFRAPDFGTAARVLAGMAGAHGIGAAEVPNAGVLIAAVVVALVGPSSQEAVQRLRPAPWIAVPVGAALVGLLLLSGERVPNEFIYFQF